jgi:DNA mismatch endonuclease (patch repair protein)
MTKRAAPIASIVSPERSVQMALIRGSNTKPELIVRRALHGAGLRFRLHDKRLPGKPDIVLPSRKLIVFVHGCFWHRHKAASCKLARLPKSRLDFWLPKLEGNASRDKKKQTALKTLGWRVVVFWECRLADKGALERLVAEVKAVAPAKKY